MVLKICTPPPFQNPPPLKAPPPPQRERSLSPGKQRKYSVLKAPKKFLQGTDLWCNPPPFRGGTVTSWLPPPPPPS